MKIVSLLLSAIAAASLCKADSTINCAAPCNLAGVNTTICENEATCTAQAPCRGTGPTTTGYQCYNYLNGGCCIFGATNCLTDCKGSSTSASPTTGPVTNAPTTHSTSSSSATGGSGSKSNGTNNSSSPSFFSTTTGIIVIIVVVLLAIGIVVGAFVFFRRKQYQEDFSEYAPTQQQFSSAKTPQNPMYSGSGSQYAPFGKVPVAVAMPHGNATSMHVNQVPYTDEMVRPAPTTAPALYNYEDNGYNLQDKIHELRRRAPSSPRENRPLSPAMTEMSVNIDDGYEDHDREVSIDSHMQRGFSTLSRESMEL